MKNNDRWNDIERCRKESLKYKNRTEFRKESRVAYESCNKKRWLDIVCVHMGNGRPVKNTKEVCGLAASKCATRTEFSEKQGGEYASAWTNGWLDDICGHMKTSYGRWQNKDNCRKEAMKHSTRSSFKKAPGGAYNGCAENGWLDDVCAHMTTAPTYKNDKSKCHAEALKCTSRNEFCISYPGAYGSCAKNKWMDEVCSHMPITAAASGFWDLARCREAAMEYTTRSRFQKGSGSAYQSCRRNGWLDMVCSHMMPAQTFRGVLENKCVYLLSHNRTVKVGITNDANRREKEHRQNKTMPDGFVFTVTHDYMNPLDAVEIEKMEVIRYNASSDYVCINNSRGGEMGGSNKKWTKHACMIEASKYMTRSSFQKGSGSAYTRCTANKWTEDVCSHMVRLVAPSGTWSKKENCYAEALKYTKRYMFAAGSVAAYRSCRVNNWLDDACSHMKKVKPSNIKTTRKKK